MNSYSYSAKIFLQIAFIAIPILMGFDKFINILGIHWMRDLSPLAKDILGGQAPLFMNLAGIFEILLGIGIIFKPKICAFVLSLWLLLIVINLVMAGVYDDAVRDGGLCLSALALGLLSLAPKKQPSA